MFTHNAIFYDKTFDFKHSIARKAYYYALVEVAKTFKDAIKIFGVDVLMFKKCTFKNTKIRKVDNLFWCGRFIHESLLLTK
jgi:hypothetical protein